MSLNTTPTDEQVVPEVEVDPPAAPVRAKRVVVRSWPRTLVNTVLAIVVAYLVVVPLLILVYSSLKDSGSDLPFQVPGLSLANYIAVFTTSTLFSVILNTLLYVVGTLIVSLILSLVTAYLFVRTDIPGRRVLESLTLAPMAIPVTVGAIAWALVANPVNGPLAIIIRQLFGLQVDVYTLPGMILVMGLFGVPTMYLMIAPALASIGPEFEEAAATLGTPLWTRLRLIVLPLIKPAVSSASILLLVVVLEGFAIPALLGLPKQIFVFSSLIQQYLQPPSGAADYGKASTYGIIILAITLALTLISNHGTRDASRFKVVTGKGYKRARTPLGAWRIPIAVLVWFYMILSVLLPVLALVWTSLSPNNRPISLSGLNTLTLDNYVRFVTGDGMGQILWNTAQVVLVTATVTTALATWIALAASRNSFPGSKLLMESTTLVLGIPSIVLGAGVLFLYLFLPVPLYGTVWIIVIALVTRFLPRGARLMQPSIMQIDEGLTEAARVTGATPFTITRTIMLPLLRPALLKTWLWVFAHALGELPIALLLTSSYNKTLVVELWDSFTTSANYPQACALAVVVLIISAGATLVVNRIGTKGES